MGVESLELPKAVVARAEAFCRAQGLRASGGAAVEVVIEALRGGQLDEARTFLDSVIENIPDMIFVKDAAELRFRRFNRAGEQLLGYPREDLLGKNDYDLFPEEQANFFTEADRRVLATGALLDIPEETIRTKSGKRVLHTKKIPILDSSGRPAYLLGISEDITDQKRAEMERLQLWEERAARTSAERASQDAAFLAEASNQLAASLDLSRTLAALAELAVPILGDYCVIELADTAGRGVTQALAHVDANERERLRKLLSFPSNGPAAFPWKQLGGHGHPVLGQGFTDAQLERVAQDAEHLDLLKALRPESHLIAALELHGEPLGHIVFVRMGPDRPYGQREALLCQDLADRIALAADNARLYEQAQAAVQVRDAFLAVAAHELKTPLTALQLGVQAALRAGARASDKAGAHAEEAVRPMRRLERQVQRLANLVDDLLDVSRVSTRQVALERGEADLTLLTKEVMDRLAEPLAKAGCSVTLTAEGPVTGYWDRTRVYQVITNLLSNALKYGGGKPIEVEVSGSPTTAYLRIRDHVIGIPPEDQDRIFGQFERAVPDRNYGGLGLGLWIAQQAVGAHGGTIQVDSAPEEGATFTVLLPRNETPHQPSPSR